MGTPYQWGGLAEGETFDCSGFVDRVLQEVTDSEGGN